ncbi:NADH-quinone oxidoreductase subunit J [Entomobacter blattae]|uniref:NADH-quinone oxidoreductase subunit J n=1 Tax=Entomobacter blattae TaxID=2762277 RepID=A0A7H1NSX8_9PROT|nr:NADH-quinone oxidoreductase subunit J [Entomobacter blattae]QNT78888.1 NADH-ubiquinone/plastoquinone oxidoreductase chain 6 [Entomobacter blattae]
MLTQVVFYVFATIMILSAAMVVSVRNPVHSVLFLIVTFFNAAGLFLVAGAEFLAFLLIIVYVGAVAILFLFVVMMLDIDFASVKEGFQRYAPVGAAISVVLLVEIIMAFGQWELSPSSVEHNSQYNISVDSGLTNTAALGQLIYTHYIFLFQTSALILLVAMIGAIVLTLRERPTARRQIISLQHEREPKDTLVMVNTNIGQGVKENGGILRPVQSYYITAAPDSFIPGERESVISEEKQR